jgi:hypothetical protein
LYYKEGLANPKPPLQISPPHRYYLTKKGDNIFVPAGAEIGDSVHSHTDEDECEFDGMQLDEIVALANATSIAD